MSHSKNLKFCIMLLWLIYIGQILTFQLYNPSLHSAILISAKEILNQVINYNNFFYGVFVIETALFIYSSTMLWFGYRSGRWTFLLWVFLTFINNFFFSVQAYSFIDNLLEDLNFFVMGVMCVLLFLTPLQKEFSKRNSFKFWPVFLTFFLLFIIFFGVPFVIRSLLGT